MALFWKTAAGLMMTAVLVLAVGKQEKDLGLLLTMAGCTMAILAGFTFLEPVLEFLYRLADLGQLETGVLGTLLKITGIGLTAEITAMICRDSGNASLASGAAMLGSAVMLCLSIPILETMMDLIQDILGGI